MSAVRYCGALTIRLTYSDVCGKYCDNGSYRVTVTSPDGTRWLGRINAPAVLTTSVDHPLAFDSIARAALAFAGDEMGSLDEVADYAPDGSGYLISRKQTERSKVAS